MTAPRTRRGFGRDERGTAAIEFAFVLPVMILVFAGMIEFGRAWQSYGAANRLASRYAIAWADCSDPSRTGACGTEIALYTSPGAIRNFAPQLTNPVTLRMFEVTMSGTTPQVLYASSGAGALTAAETAAAQATFPDQQTGVIVSVGYAHTPLIFQALMAPFLGSSLPISYTVAQRKS